MEKFNLVPLEPDKVKLPTKAFTKHTRQIGPDYWEDYTKEYIVWNIFDGIALVSKVASLEPVETMNVSNLVVHTTIKMDLVDI